MNISGNTILITGGATGIGYAFAERFLLAGNKVIICGRREEKLLEAQRAHPDLEVIRCDLAEDKDRRELVSRISSDFKSLNVLINNAGIQRDIDFNEGTKDFYSGENEIIINLESPIILTALLIPLLKENGNPVIINVSSGLGFVPAVRTPIYSATKAAIHAFTLSLRQQLMKSGIKVFEIIPPAVDTGLNSEGRARRGNYRPELKPPEFVTAIMEPLKNDIPEIGYGHTEDVARLSRDELDRRFREMNSRW